MWTVLSQKSLLQLIERQMISSNYNPPFPTISKREMFVLLSQNWHLICVFLRPQQPKGSVRLHKQIKRMLVARFVLRLRKLMRVHSLFNLIVTQPNSLANSKYMEPLSFELE